MSKIKSFRGKLDPTNQLEAQNQIYLSGGPSDTGFRIVRFDVMPVTPDASHESVIKLFRQKQSVIDMTIDFTDDSLLAAAWYAFEGSGSSDATGYLTQIFDNSPINQDLFITCAGGQSRQMNYYIELEEFKMSGSEQAVVNFNAALLHSE
jgi:hypothetical protein